MKMDRTGVLRTTFVVLLLGGTILAQTPKTKRPPPVLSNKSFRNLTALPPLPGELNQGNGETSMTEWDIQRTVDRHNEHRKNSRASNMQFMTWDATLATMAQRWAERCVFEHGFVENLSPYESVGQNLWLRGGDPNKPISGVVATDDWHDEIDYYYYESDTCTSVCGHYTQVVWAETNKVGCGLAYCGYISGYRDAWNFVCNYGPAGNFYGERPYKTGNVCTQCPTASPFCFNGLCRLCNLEEAGCSCPLTCQNCGVFNKDKCYCECPGGFYGPQCADECVDTHRWCGANPGWPSPASCSWDPSVPKGCPLMCGVCQARDPEFTCDPNQPGPGPADIPTPDTLCNTAFDSVAMINGELNVIKGKKYWRFDQQGRLTSEPSGELLKHYHSLVKKGVKALYQIGAEGPYQNTISMVRGKKIWRFDGNRRRLNGWPRNLYNDIGIRERIAAAVHDERYGITYLIAAKTSNVYEYDESGEQLVQDNPLQINAVFGGLPVKITGAFRSGGSFFFLRGKKVYEVNQGSMSVVGSPVLFAERFLGC
ncbi:uncharacterized protein LOC110981897 [Acanthaster planci]|uniref:Uncharacterized protein LOC110981897 n=1 Tax=Acanthaster planci TaxID=133434 RepID=A0A8B7YWC5_ACAPL|nr:uncharacterized protein LOC110981897 [Acanthaster planci]